MPIISTLILNCLIFKNLINYQNLSKVWMPFPLDFLVPSCLLTMIYRTLHFIKAGMGNTYVFINVVNNSLHRSKIKDIYIQFIGWPDSTFTKCGTNDHTNSCIFTWWFDKDSQNDYIWPYWINQGNDPQRNNQLSYH